MFGIVVLFASLAQAQTCIPLKGTKACPVYDGYEVQSTDAYTDLGTFDQFIASYSLSNATYIGDFRTRYNCPTYDGKGQRYHLSFLCGLLVDVATSMGCNSNKTPPQLCKDKINTSIKSVTDLYANTAVCTAGDNSARKDWLERMNIYLNRFNTSQTQCFAGFASEQAQCGFATEAEATSYCNANSGDACCGQRGTSLAELVSNNDFKAPSKPAGDGGSSGPNPVIIGAAVAGFVGLLVIVFLALLVIKKRRARQMGGTPKAAEDAIQIAETYEVIYNYVPNLSDEIYLYVGDKIIVKVKFDDGWALGYNMSTKQEGSFPLACVAPFSADKRSTYKFDNKDKISQRASSLYNR